MSGLSPPWGAWGNERFRGGGVRFSWGRGRVLSLLIDVTVYLEETIN